MYNIYIYMNHEYNLYLTNMMKLQRYFSGGVQLIIQKHHRGLGYPGWEMELVMK